MALCYRSQEQEGTFRVRYGDFIPEIKPETRNRILFTIGALIAYKIGSIIPIPGLNLDVIRALTSSDPTNLASSNKFVAGAMGQFSILSLGIRPFLAAAGFLYLVKIAGFFSADGGDIWRRRVLRLTILFAAVHACLIAATFNSMPTPSGLSIVNASSVPFFPVAVISLTAGALFAPWLAQQITKRGVANGVLVLIFLDLSSLFGSKVRNLFYQPLLERPELIVILLGLIVGAVVFMESLQLKIPVQLERKKVGNKVYPETRTFLPIHMSQVGVAAIAISSGITAIPLTVFGFFPSLAVAGAMADFFRFGHMGGRIFLLCLIVAACYVIAAICFDIKSLGQIIEKSGGEMEGRKDASPISEFIEGRLEKVLLVGGIYAATIASLSWSLDLIPKLSHAFAGVEILLMIALARDIFSGLRFYNSNNSGEGKIVFFQL
ncbi:MAG: hypothetical protein COB53_01825 [Elusimicrobia bacterium]|nr:MAG: hypothetical protein COB53_01825 [Elusimicrobiota bacterium]